MLPWLTGPRQQQLAPSEALCRSATCQHNWCDQPPVPGDLLFLGADEPGDRPDAPMTDGAGGGHIAEQTPCWQHQQGHSQDLRSEARQLASCCLWPDLMNRV